MRAKVLILQTGALWLSGALVGKVGGASTITGGKGERMPSAQELGMAASQGRHVATIAAKLFD